jgi:hypothetical protein
MFLLIAVVLSFDFYERYVQSGTGVTTPAIRDASTIASYVLLAVVVLAFIFQSRWCRPLIVIYLVFELCRWFYLYHIGYFPGLFSLCHAAFVLLLGSFWLFIAPPLRKDVRHD